MTLPLRPDYPPMEALSVSKMPTGPRWQYEPKWDGFRCLVFKDGTAVELRSKAGRPLGRYFPELVEAVAALEAVQYVLDGEIVVPVDGSLSFDDLLLRIHPAQSRITRLAVVPTHVVYTRRRRSTPERRVRAMEVVVVQPVREGLLAVLVRGVELHVSPLRQEGLDEALRLPIGLGTIGAGDLVADLQRADDVAEGPGICVAKRPVGHHSLHTHTLLCEKGDGGQEETRGGGTAAVGQQLGKGQAGGVIDGHMEDLVAGTPLAVRPSGSPQDSMAAADGDPPERLRVEVNELPRMVAYIADGESRGAVEVPQS